MDNLPPATLSLRIARDKPHGDRDAVRPCGGSAPPGAKQNDKVWSDSFRTHNQTYVISG